jgi:hypothetical protein
MTVVRLPTAPKTFIRVKKGHKSWLIQIVTPCETGKPLCTTVASSPDAETAIEYGKETAHRMQRPFHAGKAGAA